MTAQTCRTCLHYLSRMVLGHTRLNHYCTRDDEVADLWRMENKPNRCLPIVGARDCPGFERRVR